VSDHRFKDTFEKVYTAKSLQVPWYVVAGNHDHNGNVDAQIEYSKHSKRWHFPSYYYTFTQQVPGSDTTVQFVMIDTVTFAGVIDDHETCARNSSRCQLDFPGPSSKALYATQLNWLKDTLANSTADHLIVAGHYPVYSVAEHGPTAELVSDLKPLLEQYNAHYFNGHDHTMEFIQPAGFPGYYTTGAAHECDPSKAHTDAIPKGSLKFHDCRKGGFIRMEVDDKGMTAYYYDGTNKLVFTAPTKVPRKHAK